MHGLFRLKLACDSHSMHVLQVIMSEMKKVSAWACLWNDRKGIAELKAFRNRWKERR